VFFSFAYRVLIIHSGRGGSKITEIRRLSGSRISIAKVPHDETGERMFTIVGTPESTERALMLLYSQLESEKERREFFLCHPRRAIVHLLSSVGVNSNVGESEAA
jgi:hypothetical protein